MYNDNYILIHLEQNFIINKYAKFKWGTEQRI